MKNRFFLHTLLLLIVTANSFAQSTGINFEKGTWQQVLEKAQKEKKPIFVDLFTSWCGPCKQMAQEVFPQQKVGDYFNQTFINYKIDAEYGEGIHLASKYLVNSYPTYLFIDFNKNDLIQKISGAYDAESFINIAKNTLKLYLMDDVHQLDKQYPNRKNDSSFLIGYITKKAYAHQNINEPLFQYIQLLPEHEKVSSKTAELLSEFKNKIIPANDSLMRFYVKNKKQFDKIDPYSAFTYIQIFESALKKILANKDEKQLIQLMNIDQQLGGGIHA